mmetsp:Transcript_14243/g.47527  ORF Transcript_14243/g.47527 Transcript_14243/m.47527 type:complete len:221 (-) Transcript_14243:215-877(-)
MALASPRARGPRGTHSRRIAAGAGDRAAGPAAWDCARSRAARSRCRRPASQSPKPHLTNLAAWPGRIPVSSATVPRSAASISRKNVVEIIVALLVKCVGVLRQPNALEGLHDGGHAHRVRLEPRRLCHRSSRGPSGRGAPLRRRCVGRFQRALCRAGRGLLTLCLPDGTSVSHCGLDRRGEGAKGDPPPAVYLVLCLEAAGGALPHALIAGTAAAGELQT